MTRVLVSGATGNVGGHLVRALRERGAAVRALVRDPARAAERLGPDVELVTGDLAESATLRRAATGMDAVFVTTANGPDQVAHECALIDAATAAWVPRIVKLSTVGAAPGSPAPFWDAHGRVERHLAGCRTATVVLRGSFFMSNLLMDLATVAATGQLVAPAGDAPIAMVDPRDVAAAAAAVLLTDRHDGRTYTLTGPAAVTFTDVAATMSTLLGRPVSYVDVPDEAARAGLREAGLPGWFADALVATFAGLRTGVAARPTSAVAALTAREPRSLAAFLSDAMISTTSP